MKQASLIYLGITFLLALVDAIRIKIKWGGIANINHSISYLLAICTATLPMSWWGIKNMEQIGHWEWRYLPHLIVIFIICGFIRLIFYDPILNFLRILTKTNPTMRLDYVSTKTSSYEDQHSEKLSFWQKRGLAVVGYAVVLFVYYKIF